MFTETQSIHKLQLRDQDHWVSRTIKGFAQGSESFAFQSGQMTPPLTPAASSEDLNPTSESSQFPNYLRAVYPFHPPCDYGTSTVTLPLNQGDIILIHSVHSNGWADGTLLDSAHRGWLPTNYCEEYNVEPVRTLLSALTNFWDSASDNSDGTVAIIHSQNLMRGLIAGVRYLLVRMPQKKPPGIQV
jgi:hypothetical protein